jgi:acyl carrier protein
LNLTTELQSIIVEASDGAVTIDKVLSVGDTLKDLGLDSLSLVKIVVLIEEAYEFELDIELATKLDLFASFERLQKYVEQQISLSSHI